jgi:hypothetical protein
LEDSNEEEESESESEELGFEKAEVEVKDEEDEEEEDEEAVFIWEIFTGQGHEMIRKFIGCIMKQHNKIKVQGLDSGFDFFGNMLKSNKDEEKEELDSEFFTIILEEDSGDILDFVYKSLKAVDSLDLLANSLKTSSPFHYCLFKNNYEIFDKLLKYSKMLIKDSYKNLLVKKVGPEDKQKTLLTIAITKLPIIKLEMLINKVTKCLNATEKRDLFGPGNDFLEFAEKVYELQSNDYETVKRLFNENCALKSRKRKGA